ncbi:MAG: hypothetical protein QNL12_02860 [Acidimicrobiia bacterium]|nr:hypothetical protein [Acidimicrobiia bacterium]
MKRLVILFAALALALAACGGGDDADSADLPINTGDEPAAALDATCLVGEPECNDTPGGEPTDLPDSSVTDLPLVPLNVGQVLDASGPAMVSGFLVKTDGAIRLCEALAESFPPQCGGASITLSSLDQIDPDELQNEGSVTWTDFEVLVSGELLDGTLVVTPIEQS